MQMVKRHFHDAPLLQRALAAYGQELDAVVRSVTEQVTYVSPSAGDYIPNDLRREIEHVGLAAHAIEDYESDRFKQFEGVWVRQQTVRTIASALAFWREDITRRIATVEADSRSVPGAVRPLLDALDDIDASLASGWVSDFGPSSVLEQVEQFRLRRLGQEHPAPLSVADALAEGEGQRIEFMDRYPGNARELAKEIAAFATSNPGTIFLGVTDAGEVVGLDSLASIPGRDALQKRVEGVGTNGIQPSLVTTFGVLDHRDKLVARIGVPKGSEPIYFCGNVPYVRHLSQSRPATPQEVTEHVRRSLERYPKADS